MKKEKKKFIEISSSPSPIFTIIGATFCAIILLAHLIASFFPHHRLWGINHLAYFPLSIRIILLVLSFSVFIPGVNRTIRTIARNPLTSFYERISKNKLYLWYAGFSLLSMGLFWLLRSRTYFWGDGLGLVSTLNQGGIIRMWSEILEILLHLNLHKFLNLLFSADAQLTYQVGSTVAGGIFVFFTFLFSEYVGRDLFEKIFVFSILFTMGSIQLFFGSVENYSFAYLSLFAYLVLSLRWIDKGGSIFIVVLPFMLALAFHLASFYLLPSMAYLLLLKRELRLKRKVIWGLELGLFLMGILFLFHVFESKPGLIRIFVLPVEHKFAPGYTSFSWAHLADLLNEHLLTSPVGIVLVAAVLASFTRKIDFKSSAVRFLLLVTGFQLLFHFIIDPGLGAPRDWDLFSALSLGYTILALWLFLSLGRGLATFKYVATILATVSLFSTLPWVALNASEGKSIRRFRDVMDLDPKRSRSGHYFLAQYFAEKGMVEEVEKENQRQREIYPEVALLEKGVESYNQGRLDQALDLFQRANRVNPAFPDVHFFLARTYYRQGDLESAKIEYEEAVRLKPEYVKAHIELAKLHASKGKWKEAISHYQKVLKLDVKDPVVYTDLGKICNMRNELDKAVKYFKKAIQLKEDFAEAHSGLGAVFFKLNRLDEAITEYQKVIKLTPDSENAYLLLADLYIKKGLKEKAIKTLEQFLKLSNDSQKCEEVKETLKDLKSKR